MIDGRTVMAGAKAQALGLIAEERMRQDELQAEGRFRFTCADDGLSNAEKFAILSEEVGEVAREVLTQPERVLASDTTGSREGLRKEVTQVAAICAAWIESLLD